MAQREGAGKMHDDDEAARDLSYAQAMERARHRLEPQLEQAHLQVTALLDQILTAAAGIADWWEGARGPYVGSYSDLDKRTRGIVDALEEVLRSQRQPPEAPGEG